MKGRRLYFLLGFIFAAAICIVLWLGYVKNYPPIGLSDFWMPKTSPDAKVVMAYEFQRGRTLWDWMQLLVVPALLFVAGLWFNKILKEREATVALETQREAALQKYFDAVGDLIAKGTGNASLPSANPDQQPPSSKTGQKAVIDSTFKDRTSEIANPNEVTLVPWAVNLIRARTLTTLAMLDGKRKSDLMRFLLETQLVQKAWTKPGVKGAVSLQNADLRNARLRGFSLNNVYLKEVDLRGADLRFVDLKHAFIDDTTMIDEKWQLVWKIVNNRWDRKRWDEEVDLRNADLADACLNGAELRKLNLCGANLTGATLDAAAFRGAKIDETTRIDEKWFLVWKLVNNKANELVLEGSDLSHANLRGLGDKKSFNGADLTRTDLSFAVLLESDFRNVIGLGAIFNKAEMRGAKFNRGSFLAAEFNGAILEGADFSETSCSLCTFIGTKLVDSNFQRAELWSADLSDADLTRADLTRADLTEANLSGTKLEGAVLTEAKVTDQQLANATGYWRR